MSYTVLWKKEPISYEEVLPTANRVWQRGKVQPSDPETSIGIEFVKGDTVFFDDGSFYVMNENGKTVATYFLGTRVIEGKVGSNEPKTA